MTTLYGWPPAYLISFVILVSVMIFLLINIIRYNWKNGELKTRIALQIWGWAKVIHILFVAHGDSNGIFLMSSLAAMLYIVSRSYFKAKV